MRGRLRGWRFIRWRGLWGGFRGFRSICGSPPSVLPDISPSRGEISWELTLAHSQR
ncbi:hypothetical protein AGR7B_Cc250010 [Agrobacterium deltaense RV3]|nr:hypothetical protein AGR7B_Cc250010 [Agrobacterium deltaense RV3]